ncbi:hypothetical protein PF005_g14786 [Phytophthora fragariae]|uniref:DDE Tnp4 domain-containing protein n=1 Tax=Phytophthora fragariae TaxID=53985 RepID=A0A6A3XM75_9STRA|nr:hypothetical protein PF003_g18131 [Phytophthora fragariae]KAE8933759.1 hypothetical protein PF009_g16238 [Phytophthora fragariae]KAE9201889.1 hypothetical protein PF005_g14786 [Phytophthora fragariae]KAE9300175.1 hypothetical protein PF001_g15085 [Phytophthora fragariae]
MGVYLRCCKRAAFIVTTGFDVATFHFLLKLFTGVWDRVPIPRDDVAWRGVSRPSQRSLSAAGALGLVLHFLNSTMAEISLQAIFGLTPTVCSRYLNFGLRILLETLKRTPEGRISWPTRPAKFQRYADIIAERHPSLTGAFCFIDGVKIPVAESLDEATQNAQYNGWTCSHYCSSVFAFAPDGTIICALINAFGSWHDAAVAQDLYAKLQNKTPEGYFAIADSAFPRTRQGISSRIQTPLKKNSRQSRLLRAKRRFDELEELLSRNRELVSARQAVEWGMRSLQGSFARLKMPLPADDCEYRATLIEACARLHQVRTRLVGINQIKTVYEKVWQDGGRTLYEEFESMIFRDIQASDRIKRYYDALTDAMES